MPVALITASPRGGAKPVGFILPPQSYAIPKHQVRPAFGQGPKPPEKAPEKPGEARPFKAWFEKVSATYEKLGLAGKIVFALVVPGSSVVILVMEHKRIKRAYDSATQWLCDKMKSL